MKSKKFLFYFKVVIRLTDLQKFYSASRLAEKEVLRPLLTNNNSSAAILLTKQELVQRKVQIIFTTQCSNIFICCSIFMITVI